MALNKQLYNRIDSYDFGPKGFNIITSGTSVSTGAWYYIIPANGSVTVSASTEATAVTAFSGITIDKQIYGNFSVLQVSGPGQLLAYRLDG